MTQVWKLRIRMSFDSSFFLIFSNDGYLLWHKDLVISLLCLQWLQGSYDHIRCDFLQRVLRGYEFSDRLVFWILGSATGGFLWVLINGSPTKFFQSTTGLRQSCPLSPYFSLCVHKFYLFWWKIWFKWNVYIRLSLIVGCSYFPSYARRWLSFGLKCRRGGLCNL